MENKYFAFINEQQVGPLELRQLVDAGVRPSTYVWCKGMDDWHRADEVEEIRSLFTSHLNRKKEIEHATPETHAISISPDKNFGHPANPASAQGEEEKPPKFRFGRFGNVDLPEPDQIQPDTNNPPQVSMVLAVLSLLLCFWPTAIAAIYFTHKAQKTWNSAGGSEEMRRKAHDYARQAKMWLGISVGLGVIAWTLIFSIHP